MLPHGESQANVGRRNMKSETDDCLVDEDILRVIRSADNSSTPYTDATQVSNGEISVGVFYAKLLSVLACMSKFIKLRDSGEFIATLQCLRISLVLPYENAYPQRRLTLR